MTQQISRLAGVTFTNDPADGGAPRQMLLQHIYNQGVPVMVDLVPIIFHNEETGEDENAIKVRARKIQSVVGWIPRTDIEACKGITEAVLTVGIYKNTYHGVLSPHNEPTPKQYGAMKKLRDAGMIRRMPEYDRTIYSVVFNRARAKAD